MTRSPKPRKPRKPETILRELARQINALYRIYGWGKRRGYLHGLLSELRQALKQTKERR